MRAVGVLEFGGPENLQVIEMPIPEPGDGEVRVRVKAATVNPTDTMFRAGGQVARMVRTDPPFIPGMDFSGIVDALGPKTSSRLTEGQNVVGIALPNSINGGAYSEYIVLPEASVVQAPTGVSFAEASSFLMNAMTARMTLDAMNLAPGATVAVTGAAGCYGSFVIQLALAEGYRVIADAAPKDEALVRSFGVKEIVPRGDDVAASILALVPDGVDGLADGSVQGELLVPAVRAHGVIVSVRGWKGEPTNGITITPILVSQKSEETTVFEDLVSRVEDGTLQLRIAQEFAPQEAGEAHRVLEAGGTRGRLVINFAE